QRDAFVNMGENLGIDGSEAEDLIDEYLDEADAAADAAANVTATAPKIEVVQPAPAKPEPESQPEVSEEHPFEMNEAAERAHFVNYQNSVGAKMIFIPSGRFVMGTDATDAPPIELPTAKI